MDLGGGWLIRIRGRTPRRDFHDIGRDRVGPIRRVDPDPTDHDRPTDRGPRNHVPIDLGPKNLGPKSLGPKRPGPKPAGARPGRARTWSPAVSYGRCSAPRASAWPVRAPPRCPVPRHGPRRRRAEPLARSRRAAWRATCRGRSGLDRRRDPDWGRYRGAKANRASRRAQRQPSPGPSGTRTSTDRRRGSRYAEPCLATLGLRWRFLCGSFLAFPTMLDLLSQDFLCPKVYCLVEWLVAKGSRRAPPPATSASRRP